MRTSLAFFMGVLFLAVGAGCSLITDFDNEGNIKEDGAPSNVPYSIEDNLTQDVVVSLDATDIGKLELPLDEPLPNAEGGDEELIEMIGNSIQVVVRRVDVGTSVNILQGSLVNTAPVNPGEYTIATTTDRKRIDIEFFNEVDGLSLQPGQAYDATIQVIKNPYFKVEQIVRGVSVVR